LGIIDVRGRFVNRPILARATLRLPYSKLIYEFILQVTELLTVSNPPGHWRALLKSPDTCRSYPLMLPLRLFGGNGKLCYVAGNLMEFGVEFDYGFIMGRFFLVSGDFLTIQPFAKSAHVIGADRFNRFFYFAGLDSLFLLGPPGPMRL
jgi:hypothetical protein